MVTYGGSTCSALISLTLLADVMSTRKAVLKSMCVTPWIDPTLGVALLTLSMFVPSLLGTVWSVGGEKTSVSESPGGRPRLQLGKFLRKSMITPVL